jgi:hypothetical protein
MKDLHPNEPGPMRQEAPYPMALHELVKQIRYRPGRTVSLEDMDRDQGSAGLTLLITTCGYDSEHPERGETYRVHHLMPVPPASFNERNWRRWIFEQFLLVEQHEAAEFFMVGEDRPYQPWHHDGNDPYVIHELTTTEDLEARHR